MTYGAIEGVLVEKIERWARDKLTVTVDLLYRDHHNWLFVWLRKILNCQHQAADIAHDTFTRILSLTHLPFLREPRAYLVTTAKRLLINQTRKQRIEQAYLAELTRTAEAMDGFLTWCELPIS